MLLKCGGDSIEPVAWCRKGDAGFDADSPPTPQILDWSGNSGMAGSWRIGGGGDKEGRVGKSALEGFDVALFGVNVCAMVTESTTDKEGRP